MTTEQELTAMIEAEMERLAHWHCRKFEGNIAMENWFQVIDEYDAAKMIDADNGYKSRLNLVYWLATDPDDMVH